MCPRYFTAHRGKISVLKAHLSAYFGNSDSEFLLDPHELKIFIYLFFSAECTLFLYYVV